MRERLETLQVGRAVAALLVVAYHASGTIFAEPKFWGAEPFNGFFRFGHAGVYFFFVLSGFIIATAHWGDLGQRKMLATYAAKRFIRVYPAYWLVLTPIAALYLLKPEISKPDLTDPRVILNSFALVGANSRASLAVAWTLFHEVMFYALFATAIFNRRLGVILLAVWFSLCVIKALAAPTILPNFYPLSRINLLFALGLIAFSFTRSASQAGEFVGPGLLTSLGIILFFSAGMLEAFSIYELGKWLLFSLYAVGSTLAVIGLVKLERGMDLKMPGWALLLGDASYAIYLVHYPALSIIARIWLRVFGKLLPAPIAFVSIVMICIAGGLAFHIVIERPLVRFLNHRWKMRDIERREDVATSGAPVSYLKNTEN